MPDYDQAYRRKQSERTAKLLSDLDVRADSLRSGRVIPGHGDLPIGAGRQFEAAVLFLDICGSSGRGSDSYTSQADLLRALTVFFAEMMRIVEDHGGTVEKNTGDGLMAYFLVGEHGLTVQQTALSAALTMMAASDDVVEPALDEQGLERIPFRICLDYGPITVAEVGVARGFRSIVAVGATANIASKMLGLADEGEILLGDWMAKGLPPGWSGWLGERRETGFVHVETQDAYACRPFKGEWRRV